MRLPVAWLLTALLVFAPVTPALSAEPIDNEMATKVKAAYLFQFPRFVQWPAESFDDEGSPIVIGVLGEDPFGRTLDATAADQKLRGRSIEIRRLGRSETSLESVAECHVLFVSDSLASRLDTMLEAWREASVLTVSDIDGFAARGGVIELAPERGRIIFKVNRDAAKRAGLKLSAKLLKLARIVEPGTGE